MSTEPLSVARQGNFFVGGHYEDRPDGRIMTGQMYVEYQIPARQTQAAPIVMIHGGFQTGTNFTGTPDGREGWAQYFLRRGYAVYVVDTVGRGRSAGNVASYGEMTPPGLDFARERFIAPARARKWPQAALHTQFPGTGAAGDAAFDEFFASQVSSIADFPRQQELNAAAGADLIDRIGPCILLTHSQAGTFGWLIADRRPGRIKAIVAVEPNGPPAHDAEFLGAPDWFADNPTVKAGGLCHAALTYAPPLQPGPREGQSRELRAADASERESISAGSDSSRRAASSRKRQPMPKARWRGPASGRPTPATCALSGGDSERGAESDVGVMNIADEADLSHVLCDP